MPPSTHDRKVRAHRKGCAARPSRFQFLQFELASVSLPRPLNKQLFFLLR
jgi:hypothetical protein